MLSRAHLAIEISHTTADTLAEPLKSTEEQIRDTTLDWCDGSTCSRETYIGPFLLQGSPAETASFQDAVHSTLDITSKPFGEAEQQALDKTEGAAFLSETVKFFSSISHLVTANQAAHSTCAAVRLHSPGIRSST